MTPTKQTKCVNPATGETLGYVPLNDTTELEAAVASARSAQPAWSAMSVKERIRHLVKVRDHLSDNADELAEIIARDNGKTRLDALATEVLPATLAVDYYCRKAKGFLKDCRVFPGTVLLANKATTIRRVPYGIVGIISPWNYPFGIPFSEVVMALLAGNAVVLKVASQTQLVGRALAECMDAAQLPQGIFTHLNLPGHVAGPALVNAGIDKLFFTGSTAVGKGLMSLAAERLLPVNLELGGNDPMLVCPDADIYRAAAGAVWAGLQNSGQSCGGVERVYVHREVYQPFLEILGSRVRQLRVGYDTDYQVDLGAMTTAKQVDEVRRQVEQALEAGARVYAQSSEELPENGHFLPAMVLTEVDHQMDIMRLETFGPVLAVMPVDDMDAAVALANDNDLGLTASVWTTRADIGKELARRLQAGAVTINDHLVSHGMSETPWGGFKQSGIGRTHGALGMAEMTQAQCVVTDWLPRVKKNMWWHPHSPAVYGGVRGMLELLYGRRLGRRLRGLTNLLKVFPRTFRRDD
jgi:succinate-semialdehyde dehydrogenase/glutarate-semialdehyde dehydrogenase